MMNKDFNMIMKLMAHAAQEAAERDRHGKRPARITFVDGREADKFLKTFLSEAADATSSEEAIKEKFTDFIKEAAKAAHEADLIPQPKENKQITIDTEGLEALKRQQAAFEQELQETLAQNETLETNALSIESMVEELEKAIDDAIEEGAFEEECMSYGNETPCKDTCLNCGCCTDEDNYETSEEEEYSDQDEDADDQEESIDIHLHGFRSPFPFLMPGQVPAGAMVMGPIPENEAEARELQRLIKAGAMAEMNGQMPQMMTAEKLHENDTVVEIIRLFRTLSGKDQERVINVLDALMD